MNASRRAVALTAAGVVGALAAGVGIGAGVYASVAPATTTTTVIQSSGNGRAEDTSATAPRGLSVNAIYQRTQQGVVDITRVGTSRWPAGAGEGSGWVYDTQGRHRHEPARRRRRDLDHGHASRTARRTRRQLVGSDSSTDLAVVRVSARRRCCTRCTLGDSRRGAGRRRRWSRSAARSASRAPSRAASSARSTARSTRRTTSRSERDPDRRRRSTTATRAARCSTRAGQVIGVNAQIQSDSGGNDGVGFAIPSNTVRSVVAQIVAGKTVAHAYLGVSGPRLELTARRPAGADLPGHARREGRAEGR